MADLTQRQVKILQAIVNEFIDEASPIGSGTLEKKYNFGVCPATLRNEMSRLAQMGYVIKEHSSSGRIPTSLGIKFYVRELMSPRRLSVSEEVGVKEKIWDYHRDFSNFLKESVKELSRRTHKMALAVTNQGNTYFSGMAYLLDEPEFLDIDVTRTALSLTDRSDFWMQIMDEVLESGEDRSFYLLVGHDLGEELLEPCGVIFKDFESGPYKGIIGVLGPARQRYEDLVPLVNYFAKLVSEVGQ